MDTLTASAPSRHQPESPATPPATSSNGPHAHRRDLGGATPWLFYGGLVVAAVLVLLTAVAWMSPATSSASSARACSTGGGPRCWWSASTSARCTPTGPS